MGCWRDFENRDVTRGSNLSGDLRKNRLSDRPWRVVVAGRSAVGREPDRGEIAAVVEEFSGENRAVPGRLAFARVPLHHEPEAIARLQVRAEVNFPREDIGEAERQVDALSCLVDGRGQRRRLAVDLAFDRHHRRHLGDGFDAGDEARHAAEVGARQQQAPIAIDLIFEPADTAVEQPIDQVRLTGAHAAQIERGSDCGNDCRALLEVNPLIPEQLPHRRASGNDAEQQVGVLFEQHIARSRERRGIRRRHTTQGRGRNGANRQGHDQDQDGAAHLKNRNMLPAYGFTKKRKERAWRCSFARRPKSPSPQALGTSSPHFLGIGTTTCAVMPASMWTTCRTLRPLSSRTNS